jgi:high-affinity nickel-transport protein
MWLSLCALGLAQGMRHALEPDHLAAVSALASEGRSARRTLRFAALWGAGHASMLFLVGGFLYWNRAAMPEGAGVAFELCVAVMLVALGVRAIVRAARLGTAQHGGGLPHGVVAHVHVAGRSFALLPFGVGLVHGLAGSGALAALVLGMQTRLADGVLVLAVYSLGTVAGMALLAGLLGKPLQRAVSTHRAHRLLLVTAGALSLVIGVAWGAGALHAGPSQDADQTTKSSSWILVT